MTLIKKLRVALLAGIVCYFGSEAVDKLAIPDSFSFVSPAHAIVGRPLTPVSVAGVARRTVRRCAAGLYC